MAKPKSAPAAPITTSVYVVLWCQGVDSVHANPPICRSTHDLGRRRRQRRPENRRAGTLRRVLSTLIPSARLLSQLNPPKPPKLPRSPQRARKNRQLNLRRKPNLFLSNVPTTRLSPRKEKLMERSCRMR